MRYGNSETTSGISIEAQGLRNFYIFHLSLIKKSYMAFLGLRLNSLSVYFFLYDYYGLLE